jgi:hypothetical protein
MAEQTADHNPRITCGRVGLTYHAMRLQHYAAPLPTITVFALLIALAGCVSSSYRYPDELLKSRADGKVDPAVHAVHLPEPAVDEVAIVINNNAGFGTHAGLFVGARLSDPAGNYAMARRGEPGWERPTLRDYVEHQMVDGYRVQIFRFKLEPADIKIIDARAAKAGITVPLNCAVEVRDEFAGVGPFKSIEPKGWLSPSGLAELLLPLIEGPTAVGTCAWPNGRSCRPAIVNPVVASPAAANPKASNP